MSEPDIVERLRFFADQREMGNYSFDGLVGPLREAVAEIARLRALVAEREWRPTRRVYERFSWLTDTQLQDAHALARDRAHAKGGKKAFGDRAQDLSLLAEELTRRNVLPTPPTDTGEG